MKKYLKHFQNCKSIEKMIKGDSVYLNSLLIKRELYIYRFSAVPN
jgi:hypothetical protein